MMIFPLHAITHQNQQTILRSLLDGQHRVRVQSPMTAAGVGPKADAKQVLLMEEILHPKWKGSFSAKS